MSLTADDCIKLKAAGYTEHDIAQEAKVPTPVIIKLARYFVAPQTPIDGVDVDAMLKAKTPPKEEAKAVEIEEIEEKPKVKVTEKPIK